MPTLLYQQSNVEVFWDDKERWLYVKWIEVPSAADLQRDCEQMMRLMVAKNTDSILHDNSSSGGIWINDSAWFEEVWLPQMRGAGMRYSAWVNLPAPLTSLPFKAMPPGAKAFQTLQEAANWLRIQRRRDAAKTQRIVLPPDLHKR